MISVIIPTYNEGLIIRNTVLRVLEHGNGLISNIIVADGGSSDNTVSEACAAGSQVVISEQKGRAAQMNAGAAVANGSILYFIHADSIPPAGFAKDIVLAISNGTVAGCFRLAFDYDHWFLKTQSWFTRFDFDGFRYGDQSLFVTREVFARCKGFNKAYIVFEDNEIIGRIKAFGKFEILQKRIITSARKYRSNGVFKTQFVFYMLYGMYKLKVSQHRLVRTFRSLLKQDKV